MIPRDSIGRFMHGRHIKSLEASEQRILWMNLQMYAPDILAFSVPNEEAVRGQSHRVCDLKRQGLLPGAPNIVTVWSDGLLLIEMKSKEGRMSKYERAIEAECVRLGIAYVVCFSWMQAWAALECHEAPLLRVCRDGVLTLPQVTEGEGQ